MHIIVLGAAAGGGFPQWNANSEACRRARAGDPAARPATQASIALSADGRRWAIINASPDLRAQIERTPALQPREGLRSSPIAAVLLTNGDVDAIAGLLNLREGTGFGLYAHPLVHGILDRNQIFEVVNRSIVPRRPLGIGAALMLGDAADAPIDIEVEAFAAPGKVPLYAEEAAGAALDTASLAGESLGLEFKTPAGRLVYLANCARISEAVRRRVDGAAILFMDGTLWRDDEMIRAGIGTKTGRRMGHVSMDGADGVIESLAGLTIGRRIFIHVNNTNPALLADSPEREKLEAAGWRVAYDGMELELK
ncbi:pyrroloquinoline quinone biosynthesis protein B [Arboricoccus pini]|uniref:Coenzyme PQQ synthesis protein B n=1 Tax=Arboricoccus pini TaxID=1963835 RepID=A0A212RWD5_9PROT|nr:pyrroloquinoline quinone biosynthesis protein PqqB [Arboricoccus pini]SNB77005.1 pyrroloquinoline quinone biosynthesis protein B [Arboricoccus pini]